MSYNQAQSTEFPINVLPELLLNTIHDVHAQTQAPLALIAASVLGYASVATQGVFDVTPSDNLKYTTSEYFIVLAESGERKSSVDQLLKAPIHELQEELDKKFEQLQQKYQTDLGLWRIKESALSKALSKAVARGDKTDEIERAWCDCQEQKVIAPVHHNIMLTDATSAAIKIALSKGTPSVAVVSDEAGSLLTSGLFNDTAINSMWSGHSISIDRASSISYKLENYRLAMMLMLQPGLFEKYMEHNGEHARSSGFLARCLICKPVSTQGQRFNNENEKLAYFGALDKYHRRLKELLMGGIRRRDHNANRICLMLAPEAAHRWSCVHEQIEKELGPFGQFNQYRDYASKVMEHAARIAGIIEGFCTNNPEYISDYAMYAGVTIAYWYFYQFIDQMKKLDNETEQSNANLLRSWLSNNILISGEKDAFGSCYYKKNHIRKFGPSKLRDKRRLDDTLQDLVMDGTVVIAKLNRVTIVYYYGLVRSIPEGIL